jgi:hypothetical protein
MMLEMALEMALETVFEKAVWYMKGRGKSALYLSQGPFLNEKKVSRAIDERFKANIHDQKVTWDAWLSVRQRGIDDVVGDEICMVRTKYWWGGWGGGGEKGGGQPNWPVYY